MNTIKIGDIEVTPIIENPRAFFPPGSFFSDASREEIDAEMAWMSPSYFDGPADAFVLSVHSYLCRTPDKTVIIDCGAGNNKQNRRSDMWNDGRWPYFENLEAAGFRPEDVDLVLLTHLHVDHVGQCTRKAEDGWTPTFPNARYVCSERDLDNLEHRVATKEDQYRFVYADSVKPVLDAGLVDVVPMDQGIDDQISFAPAPGHTPGQVYVRLTSNGATAMATGDVLHHPIQARHPGWNSRACEQQDVAKETRRAFLETHAETDLVVLPAHFFPCRVARDGNAFRFVDV